MKKTLIAVVAATGLAVSAITAFASHDDTQVNKIGVVDYVSVFQQVPQGQAKLNELKSDLKPQVAKLRQSQKALTKQMKSLEKNAPTLSKSQRKAKESSLNKEQQAFQQKVMTLRQQEMRKEQKAAKTFEADLNKAISQVAQKGHYNMILTKQAVPYYNSTLDVTNSVVADMKKLGS